MVGGRRPLPPEICVMRWRCHMGFVANFQQCKNFENRLRFDKVTESLKVGIFLRHSVCWLMVGVFINLPLITAQNVNIDLVTVVILMEHSQYLRRHTTCSNLWSVTRVCVLKPVKYSSHALDRRLHLQCRANAAVAEALRWRWSLIIHTFCRPRRLRWFYR